jgi:hypothetical protein
MGSERFWTGWVVVGGLPVNILLVYDARIGQQTHGTHPSSVILLAPSYITPIKLGQNEFYGYGYIGIFAHQAIIFPRQ